MTERNSLRQVPVFHVHGLNVIKRSAGIILSAGRFLHLMGGCIMRQNELVSSEKRMEGHCCANTFVSGRNGQSGFIKSAGYFCGKD